jgi:8-oxo-dGTP pyrophosphatase MutT (NUDIX family)
MAQAETKTQISAGGVAFRKRGRRIEVALISVGEESRWQLPKGRVGRGESNEAAAMREVREETGLATEMIALLDKIEYWYYSNSRAGRVRFHKFVYFYLLRYTTGDVRDHDHEVNEARWVEIDKAHEMLTFKSEKKLVERAREIILAPAGATED